MKGGVAGLGDGRRPSHYQHRQTVCAQEQMNRLRLNHRLNGLRSRKRCLVA